MDSAPIEFLRAIWTVYGGVGVIVILIVVVLFLLFRFVAPKYLDAKIAEKMEKHKHSQQIDIENMKYRISNLSDRASKIYLKEYEHLPSVWISLNEAFRSASYLTGGLRQYPNLNSADSKDFELFLENSDLPDWQRERLRSASDRNKAYMSILDRKEYNQAVNDHASLRQNIDKYAIFFSREIKKDLEAFADMLWSAIIEYDVYHLDKTDGVRIERKSRQELRTNGRSKLEELEQKIRERLWDADNAPPQAPHGQPGI